MNIFSFSVPSLVLLAGGFFSICFLIYRTVSIYLSKRFDFKIFGRLLSFVSLAISTVLLFIGISVQIAHYIVYSVFFMFFFGMGLLWSLYLENMNPSLFGRIVQIALFSLPILFFLVNMLAQSFSHVNVPFLAPYAVSMLNAFALCSMFIMYLIIFLRTRVNQFDIYSTVSFLFFAFSGIASLFELSGPSMLLYCIFLVLAETTLTYTWVTYEQRR